MGNDVFANGREISCKAADGKSICAFPDVCFTPPQTPATPPGVPVPYPNTGMASNTTNGSKSVKISGKEVMLKNKSYFKKSTGDEAGCAPKKGIITSKNMGKVYFNSWSMDVKIEGENVVRHLDLTTHNHNSPPGNSPPIPHIDSMSPNTTREGKAPCAHEWEIEKPEKKYSSAEKKDRLRKTGNIGDAFEADAADHNNITNGEDLSGPNKASKLYSKCKKCRKMVEIDHITRNNDGTISSIVECKSGNSGIKGKQALERIDIANQLGCKAKYKIQAGEGGDKAAEFLKSKGWNPSNIIKI